MKGIVRALPLLLILILFTGCAGNSLDSNKVEENKPGDNNYISSPVKLLPGNVIRVVDGDTAVVSFSTGKKEKVRFIGVNTPESTKRHEPYGSEAYAYSRKELTGKKVYLEIDVGERDKYGRLLAYLWLEPPAKIDDREIRGKMFNARLLLEGYAQLMTIPPNVKYVDYFTEYQVESREANNGLWGLKFY